MNAPRQARFDREALTRDETLHLPDRFGVIGDVHGDPCVAARPIRQLVDGGTGAETVIYLGDFGMIFGPETPREQRSLKLLQREAARHQIILLVLMGNHDDWDRYDALTPNAAGVRRVRKRIGLLRRTFRATTPSGAVVAGVAGAATPDFELRTLGRSWWPQETVTLADVLAVGSLPVDVLLGHDCPRTPELVARLPRGVFSTAGIAYAEFAQGMFQMIVDSTFPRLDVGGHYHLALDVDAATALPDDVDFPADRRRYRAVTLNADGRARSAAVVDLADPTKPRLDFV